MRSPLIALAILLLWPMLANADSPITSTDFHKAYMDIKMVEVAAEAKTINPDIAAFLMNSKIPLDIKAAVINALSWDINGKKNAELFKIYLGLKYRIRAKDLKISKLNGDELFCLGYLTVMDDYFRPEVAIPILEKSRKKNPDSFTVAIILALAKAQRAMDSDWCNVWNPVRQVFDDETLARDMRPEAGKIIYDYMVLYKQSCR